MVVLQLATVLLEDLLMVALLAMKLVGWVVVVERDMDMADMGSTDVTTTTIALMKVVLDLMMENDVIIAITEMTLYLMETGTEVLGRGTFKMRWGSEV